MASAVRFYFDYISPNAYLAWTQLPRLVERYDLVMEPVPVLFAGLLEAHGQLGPAEIPPKSRWMSKNNLRKAALLRVPMNPPAFHPFNPLLALRVSSLLLGAAERCALIGALFEAVWVRALHVSEPAVVAQLADEVGLDGTVLVSRAADAECKARLRDQTADAISRGVFGVPTVEAGGELFWGYDDFPFLELFLGGNDPLRATERQRWAAASPPSAVREGVRRKKESD